ncbi:MAG: polyphosphate kinase 2 [Polyangiales bacterium]|jgi:polyphosphate kinase 2
MSEPLSDSDVELLNTPLGLKLLFAKPKVNLASVIRLTNNELRLRERQAELIKLQSWVVAKGERVVVLFEGRDSAGKGGAIRRITAHLNPRQFRVVALDKPTSDEARQWYFQRYVERLPRPGEIAFFDRSWYNRAVVEPVNEFCTQAEYATFMNQVNDFERMLVESGIRLIKFYFSITKKEQARRFDEIRSDPRKRWKLTPVDARAQELWNDYTSYKQRMFEATDRPDASWTILDANDKSVARLAAIEHILDTIPFEET